MSNEANLKKYAGEVIKKLREHKNMTQDELAEKLEITRQAVSRYENGDRGINQDLLFKLSVIFNVKIDEFFPPINNGYDKEILSNEDEYELLKKALKRKGFLNDNEELTKDNYDKLINFVKANKPFIMNDDSKK